MLLGALGGILLNVGGGERRTELTERLPAGLQRVAIVDNAARTQWNVTTTEGTTAEWIVDPGSPRSTGVFRTFEEMSKQQPALYELYLERGQSVAHVWGKRCQNLGNLFLRLLKMVAVPLIITSLLSGIIGIGGASRFGRMFTRTMFYYLATSMLAIITGIILVNLIRPGLREGPSTAASGGESIEGKGLGEVIFAQIEALLPANPAAALVAPDFLSIISFTLFVAIFALRCGGGVADRLKKAADTGFAIMMEMTMAIIRLAPLGVFFLMMYVTATQGISVFRSLGWYLVTVTLGLLFHGVITLPLIVWLFSKRNPWQFAKAMSPSLLTAFSSASSNAALPLTISSAEQRAGISNRTGSFVLPLGATINMDGTALYEAVAVLFIAQVYHGEALPLASQVIVALTALLASVGAAGIPHAGLVMMVIILQAVGLPVEMQGIILAVDRILDMARTTVNVWSDACGAAIIDAFESPENRLPNNEELQQKPR